jgi:SpoVK/Ycf46/Vps4 family AAA+-type ATPase
MPISPPSLDDAHSEIVSTPTVRVGTEAFRQHLTDLTAEETPEDGTRVLFYGGTREERQEALGTLTRHATGSVHQFRVPSLLNEYRMQTQNSLRKAFDHAAEESALLYFDKVDSLFTHDHADTPDDPSRTAAPTTLEYFFERVGAYAGIVVLGLQHRRHVEWAADKVDLIVRFE